jgi:hypothetical protein
MNGGLEAMGEPDKFSTSSKVLQEDFMKRCNLPLGGKTNQGRLFSPNCHQPWGTSLTDGVMMLVFSYKESASSKENIRTGSEHASITQARTAGTLQPNLLQIASKLIPIDCPPKR